MVTAVAYFGIADWVLVSSVLLDAVGLEQLIVADFPVFAVPWWTSVGGSRGFDGTLVFAWSDRLQMGGGCGSGRTLLGSGQNFQVPEVELVLRQVAK